MKLPYGREASKHMSNGREKKKLQRKISQSKKTVILYRAMIFIFVLEDTPSEQTIYLLPFN